MKWFEFPFALFTIITVAAVVPPWMWFLDNYLGQLSMTSQFFALLAMPAVLILFLGSWIEPSDIR